LREIVSSRLTIAISRVVSLMTITADKPSVALVISDIDGTLITSNHEVTEATRAAAAKLYDRGIELSLASSRPPRSIVPLADELN
jgi:predicted mannosyl-3-phosphoglycerate phosphatase (HAD superfamily)